MSKRKYLTPLPYCPIQNGNIITLEVELESFHDHLQKLNATQKAIVKSLIKTTLTVTLGKEVPLLNYMAAMGANTTDRYQVFTSTMMSSSKTGKKKVSRRMHL